MDSVTICNMALMAAGIPAITSFEENNNSAKLCKTFFPVLRDRVLRDHTWSFAITYMELQQAAEESPDPHYPVVCYLPGDHIRTLKLLDNSPYSSVGAKILVSSFPATLVYIRRVEDSELFDPAFAEALQNLISAKVALSASRDVNMANFFEQEYVRSLAIARSIDSQENQHAVQNASRLSSFAAARRGADISRPGGSVVFLSQGNAGKQGD